MAGRLILDQSIWVRILVAEQIMKLNEYQRQARETAVYPSKGDNFSYPALGLTGESGEVAEKIKKIIRDKEGVYDENDRVEIGKELGDVLWYVAILADEFNLSLEEIAETNIEKLKSRKKRGKIGGSGDNR